MFKSTFSKYLLAFVSIILVSFFILSGIITSMMETYAKDDAEDSLTLTCSAISSQLISENITDIESFSRSFANVLIPSILRLNKDLDVLITTPDGKIIISSIGVEEDENGLRIPNASSDYGLIDMSKFAKEKNSDGAEYLVHHGNLGGFLEFPAIVCASKVVVEEENIGYVICLQSTAAEDQIIRLMRRTVINSSVWVMLATVIAIYFITERIIHPLKNMTVASKKFAKGDFSTRVAVYGEDEVAELGNAFNNMAESLENLEKMRNSFLASISHDLRTPMTAIAGFIDGITSGAIPPEKQGYYLGVISTEVHRLSRLVSQLLDVSRLESGDRKFNFSVFDVAETARIILISFEQKIDEKRLDVEFDSEEDQLLAYADKDAIHQVIYNLCHNAIKFSHEGAKFKISITRTANKRIKFSVYNEGEAISKEDAPMVFERFYKSDKSRGLDKTGIGLGLYICKTIIDAHSEEIHLETHGEKGTEFWFTVKDDTARNG